MNPRCGQRSLQRRVQCLSIPSLNEMAHFAAWLGRGQHLHAEAVSTSSRAEGIAVAIISLATQCLAPIELKRGNGTMTACATRELAIAWSGGRGASAVVQSPAMIWLALGPSPTVEHVVCRRVPPSIPDCMSALGCTCAPRHAPLTGDAHGDEPWPGSCGTGFAAPCGTADYRPGSSVGRTQSSPAAI